MRWWRDLSPLGRVMSTPDWSWVHSSNFSSIPSAVLDIRHHRENVISNSTDVTHAWASVIFSQAKNGSNNFMLTSVNHLSSCTESTARRGLSYTSYVSMFPVPPPPPLSLLHICPATALKSTRTALTIITQRVEQSQIWPGAKRAALDCSVYCTNLEQDPCLFCLNES